MPLPKNSDLQLERQFSKRSRKERTSSVNENTT